MRFRVVDHEPGRIAQFLGKFAGWCFMIGTALGFGVVLGSCILSSQGKTRVDSEAIHPTEVTKPLPQPALKKKHRQKKSKRNPSPGPHLEGR